MDNKHLPPLTTSDHPWLRFSALAGSYPAPSSLYPDYTNIACRRRRASFIIYRLSRYCRGFRRQGHLIITGKWPKFWFPPPLAPVLCWQRPRPGCGGQWGRHVPRINCHGDQEQTLTRCDSCVTRGGWTRRELVIEVGGWWGDFMAEFLSFT